MTKLYESLKNMRGQIFAYNLRVSERGSVFNVNVIFLNVIRILLIHITT